MTMHDFVTFFWLIGCTTMLDTKIIHDNIIYQLCKRATYTSDPLRSVCTLNVCPWMYLWDFCTANLLYSTSMQSWLCFISFDYAFAEQTYAYSMQNALFWLDNWLCATKLHLTAWRHYRSCYHLFVWIILFWLTEMTLLLCSTAF